VAGSPKLCWARSGNSTGPHFPGSSLGWRRSICLATRWVSLCLVC